MQTRTSERRVVCLAAGDFVLSPALQLAAEEAGAELLQLTSASVPEDSLSAAARDATAVLLLLGSDPLSAFLLRLSLASPLRERCLPIVDGGDVTRSLLQGCFSEHQRQQLAHKALASLRRAEEQLLEELQRGLRKTVLVVGSGGREHALAMSLARSPNVDKVWVAPGNAGTAQGSKTQNVALPLGADFSELLDFVEANGVHLVVVGPELPLVNGLGDRLRERGVLCFGPGAAAAEVESSKAWSKAFMRRHGIPTAAFESFSDFEAARAYIEGCGHEVVVKASGLAAGKGVVMPRDRREAVEAARSILMDKVFGAEAGAEIVVEQFLDGQELSLLAFVDGRTAVCMPAAQDHKRALDGDQGLNTGGMGAYAPAPVFTKDLAERCGTIMQRTVDCLAAEGRPFQGVLYAGFMVCGEEVFVLEYNCRFGDPETQVLLPLLDCDLLDVCIACAVGSLEPSMVRWKRNVVACTVVCAAPGYPESYPTGAAITGADPDGSVGAFEARSGTGHGVTVFHAGTRREGAVTLTSGGRVLAVTGVADTLHAARAAVYDRIKRISFSGMHFRRDIGHRALEAPIAVGVLGSSRGTALQAVIDAIEAGTLKARIAVIISDKADALILERARRHGIPAVHVSSKGKRREEFDAEVSAALDRHGVRLVLMVGYMRIVSGLFVDQWRGSCLNVHPSLLPDFAGGMDLQVHAAVLAAGRAKSGCTVHLVTEAVDSGPILLQQECEVLPEDTPDTLKARVQALEGPLFVRAVEMMRTGYDSGSKQVITYRAAGVDIDAGEALVDRIKPACKATRRPGCDADLGGFGGLFDLSAAGYSSADTLLVSGTDGVGTKLKIAQAVGYHDSIGIDLVAMCVNDILVCGAEPLFFLDYYATGALNVDEAAAVVKGIAEGCKLAGAGLIGGETAEMSGMYHAGEYDLAGFAVGAVLKPNLLPRGVDVGDVLIGLQSSGVHSNGYSLVRKCVERSGLKWSDPWPFGESTLGRALLCPTRIYVELLMPLIRTKSLKGMAHITGGGVLDNLPRVLPEHVEAVIDIDGAGWRLPPVFLWLQSIANLPLEELLRTFNCGIGMILVVSPAEVSEVLARLKEGGEQEPLVLGSLRSRRASDSPQVRILGSF